MINSKETMPVCNSTEFPLVSVVIPVYNSSSFLADCLDSVLAQTYKNIEIICIDDCSTDPSLQVLRFYEAKDERIVILRHSCNRGLSASRNTGLDNAHGSFVCFLDSDDLLAPQALEKCVSKLLETGAKICFFNMEAFNPNGERYICWPQKYFQKKEVQNTATSEISALFSNSVMGLYSSDLFVGGKNRFPVGMLFEDWVFMSALLNSAPIQFVVINEIFYFYRRNYGVTITSNITKKVLDFFTAYNISTNNILKNNNGKYRFINDKNFVEQVIGYYESRMLFTKNEICDEFLEIMIKHFKQFPQEYFLTLCSDLDPIRYQMAMYMLNLDVRNLSAIKFKYKYLLKNRSMRMKVFSILKILRHPIVYISGFETRIARKLKKYILG